MRYTRRFECVTCMPRNWRRRAGLQIGRFVFVFVWAAWLACAGVRDVQAKSWDVLVSPSADDGTQSVGAAGLQRALDVLATDKNQLSDAREIERVDIRLSAGVYRISTPLTLHVDRSWSGTPIVISGPSAGHATIDGGRILRGFLPVQDRATLAKLAPQARGHVMVADLINAGITRVEAFTRHGFGVPSSSAPIELFFRGEPMALARWPETGFARIASVPDGEFGRTFTIADAPLENWKDEPDMQAAGYWARDWADLTLPVESVDPGTGRITLASPAPQFGIKSGQRVFVENVLSALTRPGEWYIDRAAERVYFWPPATLKDGDVEVSVADRLMTMSSVSDVVMRGVDFANARGSALDLRGVRNVIVEQASIRNVGGHAAVIVGIDSGLRDMHIDNTGEGGVALFGGDVARLTPANLFVKNSVIRNFARRSRTYKPAISMSGVGNQAIANHISDGPHAAIIFNGNDHLIQRNEIFHVATETADTGAIYTGRDWTARGTVIEGNVIHDIGRTDQPIATMGIYLDDQASGITIRRNVFFRVNQAVFIGGGRDNSVADNLFVNCFPAIYVDSRGLTWQKGWVENPSGPLRSTLQTRNVVKPPYSTHYPALVTLLTDDPGAPKGTVLTRNAVIGDGPSLAIDHRALPYVIVENGFGPKDIVFEKPMPDALHTTLRDLQISAASPALTRGFRAPDAVFRAKAPEAGTP